MERLYRFSISKAGKITAIASGVITVVICALMNLILIPKIESNTGGIRSFDMNFGYSFETAKKFLELISNEGRHIYLSFQLPLDFIYPVAYCIFFMLLIFRISQKQSYLPLLPVLLAVFDYAENILSIVMLKSHELSKQIANTASIITSVKMILMYITFLTIILCLIKRLLDKRKKKAPLPQEQEKQE